MAARFRLKAPHYLNVPGIEYETREEKMGATIGKNRVARKVYHVPLYLNPDAQADQNYPLTGEIIVATAQDRQFPADIIFDGPPTKDMEPLNDEADELMKTVNFGNPFEDLPAQGDGAYGDAVLAKLEKLIDVMGGREKYAEAAPSVNISVAEFEEMKKENAELKAKVDEVLAMLAAQAKSPSEVRRV